jgi:hypothetical protein
MNIDISRESRKNNKMIFAGCHRHNELQIIIHRDISSGRLLFGR